MMDRKDWALLVVAAADGGPISPVQLQKALFLITQNLQPAQRKTSSGFYKFTPYDYGPFDGAAYRDAEALERDGLVEITAPPHQHREYCATQAGLDRAEQLRRDLSPNVVEYLDKVVAWVRSLSFTDLVRAIYRVYPEMRANSVFRD